MTSLSELLPYGSVTLIARQLGLPASAVSKALQRRNPSHPAVKEAVRRIKQSGAASTQADLEALQLNS